MPSLKTIILLQIIIGLIAMLFVGIWGVEGGLVYLSTLVATNYAYVSHRHEE
jgi:hypothetical protein